MSWSPASAAVLLQGWGESWGAAGPPPFFLFFFIYFSFDGGATGE